MNPRANPTKLSFALTNKQKSNSARTQFSPVDTLMNRKKKISKTEKLSAFFAMIDFVDIFSAVEFIFCRFNCRSLVVLSFRFFLVVLFHQNVIRLLLSCITNCCNKKSNGYRFDSSLCFCKEFPLLEMIERRWIGILFFVVHSVVWSAWLFFSRSKEFDFV